MRKDLCWTLVSYFLVLFLSLALRPDYSTDVSCTSYSVYSIGNTRQRSHNRRASILMPCIAVWDQTVRTAGDDCLLDGFHARSFGMWPPVTFNFYLIVQCIATQREMFKAPISSLLTHIMRMDIYIKVQFRVKDPNTDRFVPTLSRCWVHSWEQPMQPVQIFNESLLRVCLPTCPSPWHSFYLLCGIHFQNSFSSND